LPPKPQESDVNPMEILSGMNLPEHPYESIAKRRFLGLLIVFIITIVCTIIVLYLIYLGETGEIDHSDRTLALLVTLLIWFVSTTTVSKLTFGKFGHMK
jgi:O-antigen/teichoic acid export membrane protein